MNKQNKQLFFAPIIAIVVGFCAVIAYGETANTKNAANTSSGAEANAPDIKALQEQADKGDVKAQYELGLCYFQGKDIPQDYANAAKWLRKAAEQGNADAQCVFGFCYYIGKGVRQDSKTALKWFRKSAEQGNANGQHNLGNYYRLNGGVPTKARFVVQDDMGQPVTNAAVNSCFPDLSDPAHGSFNGFTDRNGMFVSTGNTVLEVYARFTKEGYYPTITISPLVDMDREKIIDCWNVEIPVLLKRIRNPIEMRMVSIAGGNIMKDVRSKMGHIATDNNIVGYDLLRGEMVAPNGTGEVADIELRWKTTNHATNKLGRALDYDSLFDLRMTNGADGICKGISDGGKGQCNNQGSIYISEYEAPTNGYTNAISFYRNVRQPKIGRATADSNDDQHSLYYIRIRTQTNELGQVTNAIYGKIYGQLNGNFTSLLNPTPNDRNIEEKRKFYDPVRKSPN